MQKQRNILEMIGVRVNFVWWTEKGGLSMPAQGRCGNVGSPQVLPGMFYHASPQDNAILSLLRKEVERAAGHA